MRTGRGGGTQRRAHRGPHPGGPCPGGGCGGAGAIAPIAYSAMRRVLGFTLTSRGHAWDLPHRGCGSG
jgi:hypothetical protein